MVDVERWLSYKGTCHVILLAKLHDMYLYKTDNFNHINHDLKSIPKVALLHRFYCTQMEVLKHMGIGTLMLFSDNVYDSIANRHRLMRAVLLLFISITQHCLEFYRRFRALNKQHI